jgi:DNA-3-methyladenine glycosylase
VLIRALDPIEGVEVMRRRRGVSATDHDLCRGPGNLTKAMGITQSENRADLLGARLYIEDRGLKTGSIAWGPRIGINVGKEHPWRAWVSAHPAVSRVPVLRGARRSGK